MEKGHWRVLDGYSLRAGFLQCGQGTSSSSIPWELARNAESQAHCRPAESEHAFSKQSRWFMCTLLSERCCPGPRLPSTKQDFTLLTGTENCFNLYNSFRRWVLLCPFHRWGNWGSESLSHWSHITHFVSSRVKFLDASLQNPNPALLTTILSCSAGNDRK